MAFDIFQAGRQDLRARPLSARRDVLERLVEDSREAFPVRRLASNCHTAWEEVLTRELEGCFGKDPASTYLAGGPTRAGLKAKVRREGRFVVGGVVERSEGWSLLLGSPENGRLNHGALVHFGVGRRLVEALVANGLVRRVPPFSVRIAERNVTWLDPRLEVEVT